MEVKRNGITEILNWAVFSPPRINFQNKGGRDGRPKQKEFFLYSEYEKFDSDWFLKQRFCFTRGVETFLQATVLLQSDKYQFF